MRIMRPDREVAAATFCMRKHGEPQHDYELQQNVSPNSALSQVGLARDSLKPHPKYAIIPRTKTEHALKRAGAMGILCAFRDLETKERVVIRMMRDAFGNIVAARRLLREVTILHQAQHENIIALRDIVIKSKHLEQVNDVYLVYEMMDTSLHDLLRKRRLEDDYCRFFCYQLMRGLKYLHSAGVAHRNLKPSTLLVNLETLELRISGFFLAQSVHSSGMRTEYVAAKCYDAPELLLSCGHCTTAVDIWSAGCIFLEMQSGQHIFPKANTNLHPLHQISAIAKVIGSPQHGSDLNFLQEFALQDDVHKIIGGHPRLTLACQYSGLSDLAIDFAERLLDINPTKRMTAVQALSHPYLANLRDPSDEPKCYTELATGIRDEGLSMAQIKTHVFQAASKYWCKS
eukprot:SM000019S04955  [mRNA]  locus=s19:207086:209990:+ [translate_table: standard]